MLDDTTVEALAVQLRVLRRIGPAGRAAMTFELCDNLRSLVAAGVRHRHSQWDDQAVKRETIRYMVAGSVGSSIHGRPRATQDTDVVIDPTLQSAGIQSPSPSRCDGPEALGCLP